MPTHKIRSTFELAGVTEPTHPPGWYQNPQGPGRRYWDGAQWTDSYAPDQTVAVEARGNGLAVAALVCGLVGLAFGMVPILFFMAWALGAAALALGLIARGRAKKNPVVGRKTMATWGAVLGAAAIALGVVGTVIVDDAFNDLDEDLEQIENDVR